MCATAHLEALDHNHQRHAGSCSYAAKKRLEYNLQGRDEALSRSRMAGPRSLPMHVQIWLCSPFEGVPLDNSPDHAGMRLVAAKKRLYRSLRGHDEGVRQHEPDELHSLQVCGQLLLWSFEQRNYQGYVGPQSWNFGDAPTLVAHAQIC